MRAGPLPWTRSRPSRPWAISFAPLGSPPQPFLPAASRLVATQFDMVSSLATLLFLGKENCSQPIKGCELGSRYSLRSIGHPRLVVNHIRVQYRSNYAQ